MLVTDEAGQQVWSAEFTPFGKLVSKEGELDHVTKFTGKDLDEDSGLYYYNARWYDQEVGRFISEDTKTDPNNPATLNLYIYGFNNPLRYIDPSGHWNYEFRDGRVYAVVDNKNDTIWSLSKDIYGKGSQYKELGYKGDATKLQMGQAIDISDSFSAMDDYQTRKEWGAKPSGKTDGNTPIQKISNPEEYYDTIAIHHTERPGNESIKSLQNYFQNSRDYADIGYHFVIAADGTIYEGRPIDIKGSHIAQNNTGKIGIVLMGNFNDAGFLDDLRNTLQGASPTTPTDAQLESLKQLIKILELTYGIDAVGGHRDFAVSGHESDCPGNLAYPVLENEGVINLPDKEEEKK